MNDEGRVSRPSDFLRHSSFGNSSFGREISEDDCHQENIHEGDLEKENPAEAHQLIVAKTRQGPADPDKKEKEDGDLREKDENVEQAPAPSVGTVGHPWKMPAAEEQRHDNGAAGDHGDIFPEEKEAELHRAVFGVVPADQFRFGLGQIERQAV